MEFVLLTPRLQRSLAHSLARRNQSEHQLISSRHFVSWMCLQWAVARAQGVGGGIQSVSQPLSNRAANPLLLMARYFTVITFLIHIVCCLLPPRIMTSSLLEQRSITRDFFRKAQFAINFQLTYVSSTRARSVQRSNECLKERK